MGAGIGIRSLPRICAVFRRGAGISTRRSSGVRTRKLFFRRGGDWLRSSRRCLRCCSGRLRLRLCAIRGLLAQGDAGLSLGL